MTSPSHIMLAPCLGAVLWLALGACMADDVPVARVDSTGGMPRLRLNDVPTPPIVFFHNTDIPGERSDDYLKEQVALARAAGVHIYSLPLRCPRRPDGVSPNFARSDGLMDKFLAVDPEAKFILRVYPGPDWSWVDVREKRIPQTEYVRFADGSSPGLSIASEWFARASNDDLRQLVRHYEASDYGPRIIAWHPGGPYHEMFLLDYRQSGPDYSEANVRGFRSWLAQRYATDGALQAAWANPAVSLATANIPSFHEGRFPMSGRGSKGTIDVFYDLPGEQDWVDFSAYTSDITADRIIQWARIVTEETQGSKLSGFFYGYLFDLPGSIAGHYSLGRVLDCPDVGFLASPYSYMGRFAGEPGSFMCPVDSLGLHGKLWFNEDDTRTSSIDIEGVPDHFALFGRKCKDIHETVGVLERNFGSILAHRAGTWWMDLVSRGAFTAPEPWQMLEDRVKLYAEVYDAPRPYRPEVAVLLDEYGKLNVKDDWDTNYWTMYRLRDEVAKSGASVGYYLMSDFLEGLVPPSTVYLFANAFRLTNEQVAQVRARLDRERATAIWIYAAGYLGPDGPQAGGIARLTGMQVRTDEGPLATVGTGLLAGEQWGPGFAVSPRIVINDAAARPLGHYQAGELVAAAEAANGQHRSILIASMGPSASVLRLLFRDAGCHIWAEDGQVVQTDGSFLMVHSGKAGTQSVLLPDGVTAQPLDAEVVEQTGSVMRVRFQAGDTVWFRLEHAEGNQDRE